MISRSEATRGAPEALGADLHLGTERLECLSVRKPVLVHRLMQHAHATCLRQRKTRPGRRFEPVWDGGVRDSPRRPLANAAATGLPDLRVPGAVQQRCAGEYRDPAPDMEILQIARRSSVTGTTPEQPRHDPVDEN